MQWDRDGELRRLSLEQEKLRFQIEQSGSAGEANAAADEFREALGGLIKLIKVDPTKSWWNLEGQNTRITNRTTMHSMK